MTQILCTLFFLSGAAALLFETLWFRQAGLAFGNSVWASSLVLSSFMAGLALGNAAMARFGARIRRPVRLYAGLELVIAAAGVALVYALPALGAWLAPLFRSLAAQPWALNPLRLGLGFGLLVLPAAAMGATLPVLVQALTSRAHSFGSVLGRLYGWNTLGAVVGAIAGEAFLIERFGVRGSALVAGTCNATAAAVALGLALRLRSRGEGALEAPAPAEAAPALAAPAWRVSVAAFLAGGILLALEVVWFRFLHLFVHSGGLVFSLMLAVVLTGIAFGGFAGGRWLGRAPSAADHTATLALLAGAAVVLLYGAFSLPLAHQANVLVARPGNVLGLSVALMFPVSFLSGALFTCMGALLRRQLAPDTRAAGWLTLMNTLGAALGSALCGFVLLPLLGMERSFFGLAAGYGVVALLVWSRGASSGRSVRVARLAGVGAFALGLVLFPFGKMTSVYLRTSIDRWDPDRLAQVVAVREGRTETSVVLRHAFAGATVEHRLLTDGFAMSATGAFARRYQKLYVYWPAALHPDLERALLISYGVGSTAKALVDTASLRRIDVVDISREILALSDIVYPDPAEHPLRDPRVRVFIEDGRFFLQTTAARYDLITGEPPPPKNAGIVNLYTQEYFQLIYDRLAEGGIATYWLPVHNTLPSDTRAIIHAFCNVFADCSLWSGNDLDWMLVGSRGARWTRSEALFTRQWRDPRVAPELRAVGLEVPEQLGALFMADAEQLHALVAGTPPLTDDYPKRLGNARHTPARARATYRSWMNTDLHRERFLASSFIARVWPEALRQRTLPYFDVQRLADATAAGTPVDITERLRQVEFLLRATPLVTLPLWRLGVSSDQLRAVEARIAAGDPPGRFAEVLARRALARRDFDGAWQTAARLARPRDAGWLYFRVLALRLAGRADEALELLKSNLAWLPDDARSRDFRGWLAGLAALAGPGPGARGALQPASASASATRSSSSASPPSQKRGSVTSSPMRASSAAGASDPPARSSSK